MNSAIKTKRQEKLNKMEEKKKINNQRRPLISNKQNKQRQINEETNTITTKKGSLPKNTNILTVEEIQRRQGEINQLQKELDGFQPLSLEKVDISNLKGLINKFQQLEKKFIETRKEQVKFKTDRFKDILQGKKFVEKTQYPTQPQQNVYNMLKNNS